MVADGVVVGLIMNAAAASVGQGRPLRRAIQRSGTIHRQTNSVRVAPTLHTDRTFGKDGVRKCKPFDSGNEIERIWNFEYPLGMATAEIAMLVCDVGNDVKAQILMMPAIAQLCVPNVRPGVCAENQQC
jgi:hypothetical protein